MTFEIFSAQVALLIQKSTVTLLLKLDQCMKVLRWKENTIKPFKAKDKNIKKNKKKYRENVLQTEFYLGSSMLTIMFSSLAQDVQGKLIH